MSGRGAPEIEDHRALIAVDLGAESCRVSLLRWKQGVGQIEVVHRFANGPEQRVDGLRWNLNRIVDGVDEGLRQCAAIAKEGVRSIAVDGWAVDYAHLSDDGVALQDPFCYRDPRCEMAQQALHKRISAERLRELTGIQIQALNTVYQLYADRLVGAGQTRWLNLPEYLLYLWGGEPVAERTNATHTGLIGLNGGWCEEIFAAAELNITLAPRIVEAGTKVGIYRGKVAELHGAHLIAPCCHDTASAVAGIPAVEDDWAYISSGTWSLIGAVLNAPCNSAKASVANFTNLGAGGGRALFHKGIAGMWLLRQCMIAWGTDDVGNMIQKADSASSFRSDEWIDVEDTSLTLPGDMPTRINAQRKRRHLRPVHEMHGMARLIFDSLAGRYASVLRALEDITGKKLRQIYMVGGGSQNELLNRLTAEATGLEVKRGSMESSTVGNFAVQLAAGEDDTSANNIAKWAARLA
ncbi:rhamnulokinase [Terracidiphilus gabretensis]|uniref:rhamnulokinase n=1 Tax=Terracidiphilus gabretensis TaxID=1577687 RepID=UPI00071B0765|nr:FGGY-family carbohydrate kinase [Terracidiphilus gabretensis]